MPFQNNGTFLENTILVAIASYIFELTNIDFVNSFAMPPLSPWVEYPDNSAITSGFLSELKQIEPHGDLPDYPALLRMCLKNQTNLGPNGALLVALLAAQKNKKLRMWLNDIPNGRYGDAIEDLKQIDKTVKTILNNSSKSTIEINVSATNYPESLKQLSDILEKWSGEKQHAAIIGYLDPWYYRITPERPDSTSSSDHQQWLKLITQTGYDLTISIHFTANDNEEKLRKELGQMSKDGTKFGFNENMAFILGEFAVSVSICDKSEQRFFSKEIYKNIIKALKYYAALNKELLLSNIKIIKNGFNEAGLENPEVTTQQNGICNANFLGQI